MATGPGLAMKMTADTVGISRGVTRTEKLLGSFTKSTRQATSAMRGLVAIEVGKIVAGGFARATSAISRYVSDIRKTIDESAKLAQRTGIAVEALQGFQIAASRSGVNNLEGAVQRLTISIGDAGQGVKTAQDGLSRLGLSFEDLSRLAPEDQFRAVAREISKLPSQAEKAAAAADLFGRTGVELLPLFAANLSEIEERSAKLGMILSRDQTSAIEAMNDALADVSDTFRGIIGQVTANLAPAVTQMTEQFLSFVAEFDKFGGGGTGIANAITDGLLKFGVVLSQIFDKAIAGFNSFADNLDDNVASFSSSINIFSSITNALKVVFLSFQNLGLFLRRVAANITRVFGGDGESIADIVERQAQTRAQIDAALAGIGGAGQRVLEGGGLRAEGEDAGPIEQVVLDLIERRQKALAEGVGEAVEQSENIFATAAATQIKSFTNKAVSATKTLFGDISDNVQKAFEETRKRNEAIADLNKRYAEESEQIEQERVDALIRTTNQALEVADIRSGGIGQFISLAVGREDPAIAEARKQSSRLQEIRDELRKLGGTVEIVGAA
jgi:hypothetical protein